MAEEKVHADESAKKAGEKPAAGKPGNVFKKHPMWIAGGAALVLVVFYLMSRNSGNSNSAAANQQSNLAAQSGIDPGTGYLYGSPADMAALGGSGSVAATPGAQGNTGATGPAGPTGPAGNGLFKLNFAQAKQVAGRNGSSNLFYQSGNTIKQGKLANKSNVQYYTTSQVAVQKGFL